MLKFFFWALPMVSLLGCTSAPLPPQATSEMTTGLFKLSKSVSIDAGSARAFVQGGQFVTKPDSRDPVCVLASWKVTDQTQTFSPDHFRISDITHRRGDVSGGFGVYGSTDMGMDIGFSLGGFASPVYPAGVGRFGDQPRLIQAATMMRLVSDRQPLMYKLTCFSATGWTQFVEPPSVSEMNQILGDVAYVELNDKRISE